jgi:hypothetical protein
MGLAVPEPNTASGDGSCRLDGCAAASFCEALLALVSLLELAICNPKRRSAMATTRTQNNFNEIASYGRL